MCHAKVKILKMASIVIAIFGNPKAIHTSPRYAGVPENGIKKT